MRYALCFPGQGAQSVGMLADFANHTPEIQATFDQAGEILKTDLWTLTQDGPEETLNSTAYTQPALLAAGVAIYRCWQATTTTLPVCFAGHSLGEYTALVCAQALSFDDAIALVHLRGQLMQAAVPVGEGAMGAIIGLEDEIVQNLCERAAEGEVLSAANFNAPGQVVISGEAAAVQRAMSLAEAEQARMTLLLPVSVPSHCALMQSAANELAQALENTAIVSPKVPVINNVDVQTPTHPDDIRDALVRQLYSPVRWVECILAMAEYELAHCFEFGPSRVLCGLNKRITRAFKTTPVNDPDSFNEALEVIT